MVNINETQFGIVPGRGTAKTIFFVCQLQEKYMVANKSLYCAFVEFEGSFWSCSKEGPVVGAEEPWCQGMGCACEMLWQGLAHQWQTNDLSG